LSELPEAARWGRAADVRFGALSQRPLLAQPRRSSSEIGCAIADVRNGRGGWKSEVAALGSEAQSAGVTEQPPCTEPASRRLGLLLLAGLITAPSLFVWFLLRPGYSKGLRISGFTYASVMVLVGIAARLAGP